MKSSIVFFIMLVSCLSWHEASADIGFSFIKHCSSSTYSINNDGQLEISATGNAGPFTYKWSDNSSITTNTRTGLAPGIYTVTVTNAYGCSFVRKAEITTCPSPQPSWYPPVKIEAYQLTPLSASGSSDGKIDITISGGYPNSTTYKWVNEAGTVVSTSQDVYNLPAGKYRVTVTDGCTSATSTYKILACGDIPWAITSVIKKNCDCSACSFCQGLCSGSNGSITLTVSGGNGPYSYQWSNNPTSPSTVNSNLSSGTYTVTIKDVGTACSTTRSFTVGQSNVVVTQLSGCQWKAECDGKLIASYAPETEKRSMYNASTNMCTTTQYCDGVAVPGTTVPNGSPTFKKVPGKCRGEVWCGVAPFQEVVEIIDGTTDYISGSNCKEKVTCKIEWPDGTASVSEEEITTYTTCITVTTEQGCKIADYCAEATPPGGIPTYFNRQTWGDEPWEYLSYCNQLEMCIGALGNTENQAMDRSADNFPYPNIVSVNPNPFSRYVDVYMERFEEGEKISIRIFNMLGIETLSTAHTIQRKTGESVTLDMGKLSRGTSSYYSLVLVNESTGYVYRTKLIGLADSEK